MADNMHIKDITSWVTIGGYEVPIIHAPDYLAPSVACKLSEWQGIGAAYCLNSNDSVTFVLRSMDGVDARALALEFGGSGHSRAAVFTVSKDRAIGMFDKGSRQAANFFAGSVDREKLFAEE